MFMVMFLIIAAIKILVILFAVFILCYHFIARKMQQRNEKAASKNILRSLGRIKYSALNELGLGGDPDEECSICFMEYGENDIVTKLECNEKHIFHEQCISSWIQQGKNSCPICRAPISNQEQQL